MSPDVMPWEVVDDSTGAPSPPAEPPPPRASTPPTALRPQAAPPVWSDVEEAHPGAVAARPSPRSSRDLEILRALARRINPGDAGAHNNLGVVYYHKGLFAEAIECFEQALEIDPRMQVAERNLQIAFFHTGYFEKLVAELRDRLTADPDDPEARERLARAYFYAGDLPTAIREWRGLLHAGTAARYAWGGQGGLR